MSAPVCQCKDCVTREELAGERGIPRIPIDAADQLVMWVCLGLGACFGLSALLARFSLPIILAIFGASLVFGALAIVGRRVVAWSKFFLIGDGYLYRFDDVEKKPHCHRTMPSHHDFGCHEHPGQMSGRKVVRIRNGGIFRSNCIFNYNQWGWDPVGSSWKIRSWRAAEDLRIVDEDGGVIPIAVHEARWKQSVFAERLIDYLAMKSVVAVYLTLQHEREQNLQHLSDLRDAHEKWTAMEVEDDRKRRLLFEVALFLNTLYQEVKDRRSRRGQSPHGQFMRASIEEFFVKLDDERLKAMGIQTLLDMRRVVLQEIAAREREKEARAAGRTARS